MGAARTCSGGPRLFIVNRGRTADLQDRFALRLPRLKTKIGLGKLLKSNWEEMSVRGLEAVLLKTQVTVRLPLC